jgi:protein-S-isoprenylcysteine O-methyltransferase Ste14
MVDHRESISVPDGLRAHRGALSGGSNGVQPGHKLVTSGVYGVIRHPSYLGLLVNSLGWTLAFRSEVGVLLTVLLMSLANGATLAESPIDIL